MPDVMKQVVRHFDKELFGTLVGGRDPHLSVSGTFAHWQLVSAQVKNENVSTVKGMEEDLVEQ